jgi:hypothetical protein
MYQAKTLKLNPLCSNNKILTLISHPHTDYLVHDVKRVTSVISLIEKQLDGLTNDGKVSITDFSASI